MGQKIIPLLLVGSGYDACLLCPNLSLPPRENQFSRFPFVFAIDYLWFLLPPLPKKRHLSRGRKSLSSNKLVAWHISFGELGNLITCLAFLVRVFQCIAKLVQQQKCSSSSSLKSWEFTTHFAVEKPATAPVFFNEITSKNCNSLSWHLPNYLPKKKKKEDSYFKYGFLKVLGHFS